MRKKIHPDIAQNNSPLILFPLMALASRVSAESTKSFLKAHHCGMTEWRVLAALAAESQATAASICAQSGMDKAGVSRALKTLMGRGFIASLTHAPHGRGSRFALSSLGLAFYEKINDAALKQEAALLLETSQEERQRIAALLKRMLRNMPVKRRRTRRLMSFSEALSPATDLAENVSLDIVYSAK